MVNIIFIGINIFLSDLLLRYFSGV